MHPILIKVLTTAVPVVLSAAITAVSGARQNKRIAQVADFAARQTPPPAPNGNMTKKAMGVYATVAALAGTVAPLLLSQLSPDTYAFVAEMCSVILSNPPTEAAAPVIEHGEE